MHFFKYYSIFSLEALRNVPRYLFSLQNPKKLKSTGHMTIIDNPKAVRISTQRGKKIHHSFTLISSHWNR